MTLVSVTAYHSFGGEVEASNTPTIRRLTPSCRHQLPRIAQAKTNEAKTRFISMGLIPGVIKVILEVRSIERRLIEPDPSAQQIIDGQNLISRFLGAPEGACRLI